MLSVEERLAKLERLVEAQAARIAVLEAENAELRRRLGENSSNSSKPPSSDSLVDRAARPKDAPSGKKRGGQPGHKGHKRPSRYELWRSIASWPTIKTLSLPSVTFRSAF